MTYENRLLCDPKDILALRFICKHCSTVIVFPLDNWKRLPYACTNCEKQLMQNMSAEERTLQALGKALEQLLEINNDRFSVQFEIRNP